MISHLVDEYAHHRSEIVAEEAAGAPLKASRRSWRATSDTKDGDCCVV